MEEPKDVADARKDQETKGALKTEHLEAASSPGGDNLDAKGLSWFGKGRETKNPTLPTALFSPEYNMNHPKRGVALIFNHRHFDGRLKLNERKGTDADRDHLTQAIKYLGFSDQDIHCFEDLSYSELAKQLETFSELDHSKNDCLFVAICSHGDQGIIYARDKKFRVEELWEPFIGNKCPSLAGKPKLFFIQACQGDRLDHGTMLDETDSGSTKCHLIPSYADFLITYSTIPGFFSWRNTESGSWFMQSLCGVLLAKGKELDLLSLLTLVNYNVAYSFMSNVPHNPGMDKMKQIPCISSMLTRKLYFKSKTDEDQKMDAS